MRAGQLIAVLVLGVGIGIAVTGCSTGNGGPHHAHHDGWEKLGERVVNGAVDHDVIEVGRAEGRFTKVMIVVEHSAVEMFDMVITFGDGEKFSPPTRFTFPEGSRSREIDLPGGARVIKRVDFKYGNVPGGGRSHVDLFAR